MAVFVGGFAAGKAVDVFEDVVGDFDGGIGDRFAPGFGNAGAAFVAHRGVIRGEGRGGDGENLGALREEVTLRDGLPGAVRWLPFELNRGDIFLVGNVVEIERDRVAAEKEGGFLNLSHLVVGGNPGVDQGVGIIVDVVEPEAGAIGGADAKSIGARFGRHDGSAPVDGKSLGVEVLDLVIGFEVEANPSVGAFRQLTLLVVHLLLVEVAGKESVFVAEVTVAAEAGDEIGERAAMLVLGAAEEVFADGLELGLGFGGVKGVIHILRDGARVVVDDGILVILGHGLVNILRQGSDALLADEGFIVFIGHALAFVAMTGCAVFLVNRCAISRAGLKSQSEKEDKPAESHAGYYEREAGNLSPISPSLPFHRREEVWHADWACDRRGRHLRVA